MLGLNAPGSRVFLSRAKTRTASSLRLGVRRGRGRGGPRSSSASTPRARTPSSPRPCARAPSRPSPATTGSGLRSATAGEPGRFPARAGGRGALLARGQEQPPDARTGLCRVPGLHRGTQRAAPRRTLPTWSRPAPGRPSSTWSRCGRSASMSPATSTRPTTTPFAAPFSRRRDLRLRLQHRSRRGGGDRPRSRDQSRRGLRSMAARRGGSAGLQRPAGSPALEQAGEIDLPALALLLDDQEAG